MNQAWQDVIEHRRTTNVFKPNDFGRTDRTFGLSLDTSPDFLQPSELAIPGSANTREEGQAS